MGLLGGFVSLRFQEPSRIGKDFSFLAEKEAIDYTYRIQTSDFNVIFKKKSNIWLIVNFVDTIPTGIILFLLYEYMRDYHNVPNDTTLIFLILILLSTLSGTIFFGYVGDKQFQQGKKKARVRLALYGNVVPIPFVFVALIIPFSAPSNASIGDLFSIPGAILMGLLLVIGIFINGAVNGSWYATLVDLNLPEHRGTVLATANLFDIVGKAIGPLVGGLIADAFGYLSGINISIIFWLVLPFFWIPVLKNIVTEMESTERVFKERLEKL
jgi:MFS family permease